MKASMKILLRIGIILMVAAVVGLATWGVTQVVDVGMPTGERPDMAALSDGSTVAEGDAAATATGELATEGTRPTRPEGGRPDEMAGGAGSLLPLALTFAKMAAVIAVVALVAGWIGKRMNERRRAQKKLSSHLVGA